MIKTSFYKHLMLNASIHHSSFYRHCRSCFKVKVWNLNFLAALWLIPCEPLWPFTSGRTGGWRPRSGGGSWGPSWHLNTERGGAGASLLPTSPAAGQGMGIVKRRLRRVSTTGPGFTLDSWLLPWRGAPRKGTKEDFCCLIVTPCLAKCMPQSSNYKQ